MRAYRKITKLVNFRVQTAASLAKQSNLFPQDHKGRQVELCPPRILTGAGAEGQHPIVVWSKARMGVHLLGRARLRPDGCGDHHLRFVGTDLTTLPKRPQSGPKIT